MMTAHTMEEYTQIAETVAGVRKTLAAILALGPADAPVPGPLTSDGLKVNELPPEYRPVGLLTPEGIAVAKEVKFSDVEALGHFAPVRRDPESGSRTVTFNAYEVHNRGIIQITDGVDLSTVEVDGTTGEVSWTESDMPELIFYRAVLISFDGSTAAPILDGRFWPKVQVTAFPSENFSKSDPRQAEIGLTVYNDDELGYPVKKIVAGKGFLAIAPSLGWTVGAVTP